MSMTRKQFLGGFIAGIAGLGMVASGKRKEQDMVEAVFTMPQHTTGYVQVEGLDENWETTTETISSGESIYTDGHKNWIYHKDGFNRILKNRRS